jgi:hypothetical protein
LRLVLSILKLRGKCSKGKAPGIGGELVALDKVLCLVEKESTEIKAGPALDTGARRWTTPKRAGSNCAVSRTIAQHAKHDFSQWKGSSRPLDSATNAGEFPRTFPRG